MMRWLILLPLLALAPQATPSLAGDWDVYIALSAKPKFGFEGWRRMGFAHFAGSDSGNVGFLRRRTGDPMLTVTQVTVTGDSVLLTQDARVMMRAAWHRDTLTGVQWNGDRLLDRRFRLVRRATPFVVEHDYAVWTMPASDSQYAVTEDTLVLMPTRDGAHLATYIARPVGNGPFGVVMQRTPYRRILHGPGRWWASRGYIFIGQHVRGREESSGDVRDFGDYSTDINDGYDAVEWAARLAGANGKVGMIGHSDEGRLVLFAAVSNQRHHPTWHIVMNPGAHKGVDYVAGDFGPQARYAFRDVQLRWFDHYLPGRNNGVDTLPHIDDFVMGDNVWRQENEWPLARQHLTNFYISSGGHAQTSNGDRVLDSVPPPRGTAAAETVPDDSADPTP